MEYEYINIEIKENLIIIKLNRPEVLNSFNQEMAIELQTSLDFAGQNTDIRAIILTGEGRAFCAGQDLAEVTKEKVDLGDIVKNSFNPIIRKIRNIEKPIIAAVNGVAAGAGANIAFACDILLASDKATFIQSFSKIGLIPDSGGTYILPRLIGFQKASALMMLGDKITADEALELGLVYKVFPAEHFYEESLNLGIKLSKMPTKGLAYTKMCLNRSIFYDLDAHLRFERQMQSDAGKTYDYNEGVAAFLEKREPIFKGE